MRKVTSQAVAAFLASRTFKSANTTVELHGNVVSLRLHGNVIARGLIGNVENTLEISAAGWNSATTKDRLNGLPGVRIHQRNWQWFLNGVPWAGNWVKVRDFQTSAVGGGSLMAN